MTSCMCAGIDVDIDVEHDGQKTKVTPPPPQSGEGEEDIEMGGANSEACGEGGATATGGTTQESRVSSCVTDSSHKFFSSHNSPTQEDKGLHTQTSLPARLCHSDNVLDF